MARLDAEMTKLRLEALARQSDGAAENARHNARLLWRQARVLERAAAVYREQIEALDDAEEVERLSGGPVVMTERSARRRRVA